MKAPSGRRPEFTYRHAHRLFEQARRSADEVLRSARSTRDGLTEDEALERRAEFGANRVGDGGQVGAHQILFKCVYNPFNGLITGLAAVSYFTDDMMAALVMACMVVLSVAVAFVQELRSSRAAQSLAALVQTSATVRRGNAKLEVPVADLVPGDIIHLAAGDMIPADVRLLTSKNLAVSQAALTGEAIPVEKDAELEGSVVKQLPELRNICFMGTNIASGTAVAVVLHTGAETYFGSVARVLTGARTETNFDRGVHRYTQLMLVIMAVMAPAVFVINGTLKGDWSDAFLFAVAVAVGLTPEMLPMIVTANLAKGGLAMARKKVIVKRLAAIQNLGAMDVLCTDKTGTLTEDLVVFGGAYGPFGNYDDVVLRKAYLNSIFQTGLKNFLDLALIKHAEKVGLAGMAGDHRFLDELPFDFERKRMSVLVESKLGHRVLICKGAVEEVLSRCSSVRSKGAILPFDEANKNICHTTAKIMNEKDFRLIALAFKEMPEGKLTCDLSDESDLALLGYIAFLDPPIKESAAAAVKALDRCGIGVKILTGDNERVTLKIARDVGLKVSGNPGVLLGSQIEQLDEDQLRWSVVEATVFAKLTPDHKERIVRALRDAGRVVGFIGDGINDAPALRAADVGISVSNAVDIAKESADIILLEKNLLVLEDGVLEGRKVFGNIVKYLKMGSSSNFGNVFSMLGASVILPFLPLRPVQMLTQNLLYDFSQAGIPFDRVDEEYLLKPRRWEIASIRRFMLLVGPVSSLFDYVTFAVMWYYFGARNPATQSLFQSGWFVEGLLSQTLIVHLIRTRHVPFLQSRASHSLLLTTLVVMLVGLAVPFTKFGESLGFTSLPLMYFPCLIVILVAYALLTQVVKGWFARRYGWD